MKNVVLCLVALVVGWLLGVSFGVSEVREPIGEVPVSVVTAPVGTLERISELEASLAETESALERAQSELETVRAAARDSAPEAEVEEEKAAPVQNPFMANVQSMAAESSKQRKQEELEKLKLSLNLSPDQVAALETYYAKSAELEAKLMERVFSGESMESMEAAAEEMASEVEYHSVSQLLDELLTPEQQAVYEANKEQEDLERKEATAYRELSSLQQQFLLDESQKDQVFEIFYDKAYAVKHSEWEALGIDQSGTDGFLGAKVVENERLIETLSEVLAEDQLELYRKKLASDLEMQRKSMQMFGSGLASKAKGE
ncbi:MULTISPECIES: hypothetical protein [unclassified Lentimonas]|uniref:hypothetical protein n=1 Tax=unclassified Lentimonas TaxID=2630993 RepID=UPI00132AFAC9|nr:MULTISPECIES: hypothetical protein [unclassified Lentimonas]CAA6676693.1 Unannotated [Lentimonas sp. CC4]CAA6684643.1 Unannotated [Lentimonas sp. CC6]CAA7075278.1 Unannotated [Lentimonas sp. CC4]CAA7170664.1 Unannotated [Lentimonas sp. CC21]CAA7182313.1 Unannotated [Lentimonas sp. CC8]